MEWIKENVSYKHFNPLSFIVVSGYVVAGGILCGTFINIETQQQSNFRCLIKAEEKEYIQGLCFEGYQDETTKGFPNYGFVLLNFLFVIMVCIWYSHPLKSRIQALESEDIERGTAISSCRLYRRYCIQLAVRLIGGILFLILQWGAFYPMNVPSEYVCDLSQFYHKNHFNITNKSGNSTPILYGCQNPKARQKTGCSIIVFVVNTISTLFVLTELVYIFARANKNDHFKTDSEFFKIYLLGKKDNEIIRDYVQHVKKRVIEEMKKYPSLVQNIPGKTSKVFNFDDLYTNLMLCPGRAKHKFDGGRNEGYFMSQEKHESINKLEDIFTPTKDNPSEVPHSIIIVGRPGIGKSLMCQKILLDWACGKMFSEETAPGKCFKFVYLLKFRNFRNDEKMNLQQLLSRFQFHAGALRNEVFSSIIMSPEKVLIIFEGLDEFKNKADIINEEGFGNSLESEIPFSALYAKLTSGKVLKGATIVTTSRPTALTFVVNLTFDRTVEILGFDSNEIKKYVEKFFKDDRSRQEHIWNYISTNANLLYLCYIPISCHIVCLVLQEGFTLSGVKYLPVTKIYEDALVLIVYNHNPKYRNNPSSREELLSSRKFTSEVETVLEGLGHMAYKGIEEERLIFESEEAKCHEESGLLYRLPADRIQFCFLHITFQEFLAARYILKTKQSAEDLELWIMEHIKEARWHLVIQFISGLLYHHHQSLPISKIFVTMLPGPEPYTCRWPKRDSKQLTLKLLNYICEIPRNEQFKNNLRRLTNEKLVSTREVCMEELKLTDADLVSVVYFLNLARNIRSIDLSLNYGISRLGYFQICQLLKMGNLINLKLCRNNIGSDKLKPLTDVLSRSECKLSTLDIGYNRIGDDGLRLLSDALSTNECKLTTLIITDNGIGEEGLQHLSKALSTDECKITTLHVGSNEVDEDGLVYLSVALSTKECKLRSLDVSWNRIDVFGMRNLSGALSNNECKLTTLNIGYNDIGDDGLKHLSDALSTNECKLTTLNISGNKISDDGIKYLSGPLSKMECKLTMLDITDNRISDNGIKRFKSNILILSGKLDVSYDGQQTGATGFVLQGLSNLRLREA